MPNYKTHSIHSELIYPYITKYTNIDKEKLKYFAIGPDTLITSDYKIFETQHKSNVKDFFIYLLKIIKDNNLQYNEEIMTYLYGQIDHYILDIITHPMIYYYTSNYNSKYKFNTHGLVEHWLDDYVIKNYNNNINPNYTNKKIIDNKLANIIDKAYFNVYKANSISLKYKIGLINTINYDNLIRKNPLYILKPLLNITNIGDITYSKNPKRVLEFLNQSNDIWYNPETNETYNYSFDELWKQSLATTIKTIDDINNYLYNEEPLNNYYINNNISYNTGLPCTIEQTLKYAKK